jgi:hypothetical protein
MPDIWLDVDVAIASMSVNKFPITGTDGITLDETVAYNEAGMDLNWNFQTTAGVFTQTNVVPTTVGVHDWLHAGNSMYTIELPDTGGTVNNDTEGFGWWSGKATDIAAFISPVYGFRAAALNNALIDGGDVLDVNMIEHLAVAQTIGKDLGTLLQIMRDGILLGAATGTPTTISMDTDLTGYADSELIGRGITWLTGTAAGQSSKITSYTNTGGVVGFIAVTTAPVSGDTFKIT